MIELVDHKNGFLLPVKADAGSRRNEIRGEQAGYLKVSVTQVAEKGKANKAILDLLCKSLRLRKSQVALFSGHSSSYKRFLITGIPQSDFERNLRDYI